MSGVLLPTEVDGCSRVAIAFWRFLGAFLSRRSFFWFMWPHVAFRPLQLNTLVIMDSCQFNCILAIFLQTHDCIVAYEHLKAYPSIETVLSFNLTVGGSSLQPRTSEPSTPMCRGCRHPRLSMFHQSGSIDPCLSMQTDVAYGRHHWSSVLLSPELQTTPTISYQLRIAH
jgi:hypothetical protein